VTPIARRHPRFQPSDPVSDIRTEAMLALVDDWASWRQDCAPTETMLIVHGSNDEVDAV
jgi:hypothetical protein